jgi:hypothetical protein
MQSKEISVYPCSGFLSNIFLKNSLSDFVVASGPLLALSSGLDMDFSSILMNCLAHPLIYLSTISCSTATSFSSKLKS